MAPPETGRVNVTQLANRFNEEIQAEISTGLAAGLARPRLVGFLANDDAAAVMYARWTQRACTANGIIFELRQVQRTELEDSVIAANEEETIHGIIVYYPVFGGAIDDYLRDVISVEKDVEGLNHRYRYALYHNIRTLDEDQLAKRPAAPRKCVLPCTPLAVVKILESLGAYDLSKPVGQQLAGKSVVVFNRSEVVGRPLAAMLSNDGALVYSVDITGIIVYSKGRVPGTIKVEETEVTQSEALAQAAIVVAGVPAKGFRIDATQLRPGCFAVNFSQHQNFGEGTEERCLLVPAIGKVTIAMLERNLVRLHSNFSRRIPPGSALAPSPSTEPPKPEQPLALESSTVACGPARLFAGSQGTAVAAATGAAVGAAAAVLLLSGLRGH